ncbi:MAG: hypothetical protein ACREJS_07005 [Candidatus Rokuibacteriota bacterium]
MSDLFSGFGLDEDEPAAMCSVCGCTDEIACVGGCVWVDEDLCSRCYRNAPLVDQLSFDIPQGGTP